MILHEIAAPTSLGDVLNDGLAPMQAFTDCLGFALTRDGSAQEEKCCRTDIRPRMLLDLRLIAKSLIEAS
jgi:hypothetical protein